MKNGIFFFDASMTTEQYLNSLDDDLNPEIFHNWEISLEIYNSFEYLLSILTILVFLLVILINISSTEIMGYEIFFLIPIFLFFSVFRKATYIVSDDEIAKIYTLPFIQSKIIKIDLNFIESDRRTLMKNRIIETREPLFGIKDAELKEYEHYHNRKIIIRDNELLDKYDMIMVTNKI